MICQTVLDLFWKRLQTDISTELTAGVQPLSLMLHFEMVSLWNKKCVKTNFSQRFCFTILPPDCRGIHRTWNHSHFISYNLNLVGTLLCWLVIEWRQRCKSADQLPNWNKIKTSSKRRHSTFTSFSRTISVWYPGKWRDICCPHVQKDKGAGLTLRVYKIVLTIFEEDCHQLQGQLQ